MRSRRLELSKLSSTCQWLMTVRMTGPMVRRCHSIGTKMTAASGCVLDREHGLPSVSLELKF